MREHLTHIAATHARLLGKADASARQVAEARELVVITLENGLSMMLRSGCTLRESIELLAHALGQEFNLAREYSRQTKVLDLALTVLHAEQFLHIVEGHSKNDVLSRTTP